MTVERYRVGKTVGGMAGWFAKGLLFGAGFLFSHWLFS